MRENFERAISKRERERVRANFERAISKRERERERERERVSESKL